MTPTTLRPESTRVAAGLDGIPDSRWGDYDEVMRLRDALEFIAGDVRCYSNELATRMAKLALGKDQ